MKELDQSLLTKVSAQSGDAVAQPTFTTDIDFDDDGDGGNNGGNNDGNNGGNNGGDGDSEGSIQLITTETNFQVGNEFTLDIRVDSDGGEITAYTVKIEYNPELVQIVDADDTVSGVQIEFLDTVFNEVDNEANTTAGTILLRAESASASALDATVGKVTFKALAEGSAEIRVIAAESSLVNDTSTNILETTNGLQVNVGDTVGEPGEITDDPLLPSGLDIDKLPDSSLPFGGILYMLLGAMLIGVGLQARRIANRSKHKPK